MRKVFVLVALCVAFVLGAHAAPTVVQSCFGSGYQAPATCAFASNIQPGDVLIIQQQGTAFGASTASAPTGCSGVTWTAGPSDPAYSFWIWVGTGASGSCQPVITDSVTQRHNVVGIEVSGITGAIDSAPSVVESGSDTAWYSPNVTDTNSGDFVVAVVSTAQQDSTYITPTSPYVVDANQTDGPSTGNDGYWGALASEVASSSGSITGATWSRTPVSYTATTLTASIALVSSSGGGTPSGNVPCELTPVGAGYCLLLPRMPADRRKVA